MYFFLIYSFLFLKKIFTIQFLNIVKFYFSLINNFKNKQNSIFHYLINKFFINLFFQIIYFLFKKYESFFK